MNNYMVVRNNLSEAEVKRLLEEGYIFLLAYANVEKQTYRTMVSYGIDFERSSWCSCCSSLLEPVTRYRVALVYGKELPDHSEENEDMYISDEHVKGITIQHAVEEICEAIGSYRKLCADNFFVETYLIEKKKYFKIIGGVLETYIELFGLFTDRN